MRAASFANTAVFWVIGIVMQTTCMAQTVVASDFSVGSEPRATIAIPVAAFLNSIGVVTTFPDRGQPLGKTIEMIRYTGFRWVRGGIEGLSEQGPTTVQTYLDLHRETGVRFSWGLVQRWHQSLEAARSPRDTRGGRRLAGF